MACSPLATFSGDLRLVGNGGAAAPSLPSGGRAPLLLSLSHLAIWAVDF